ncbi:CAP domain-containing protein [Lentibacter algarum]|uniref:CAP domain-containing protein n=1 Tax=Lentibacter algarum TaxID=576131 RepID=UPI001C06D685|nr:CAP domain-containing protein [Lentibacter algarum]MBU2980762.1 CAP domain-containing protein [Lentibacter algarum]
MRITTLATMVFGLVLSASVTSAEPVREFAGWVSQLRAQNGLGPLKTSSKLEKIANKHAQDMEKRGFFSHTGSDGSTIGRRAKRGGYKYCTIGENIAQGQKSAQEAMRDWTKSPAHKANMLKKGVTEIGVVRTKSNYWVLVVAGKRGDC